MLLLFVCLISYGHDHPKLAVFREAARRRELPHVPRLESVARYAATVVLRAQVEVPPDHTRAGTRGLCLQYGVHGVV